MYLFPTLQPQDYMALYFLYIFFWAANKSTLYRNRMFFMGEVWGGVYISCYVNNGLFLQTYSSAFEPHIQSRNATRPGATVVVQRLSLQNIPVVFSPNTGVWFHLSCWIRRFDPKITRWKADVQRRGGACKDEVGQPTVQCFWNQLSATQKKDITCPCSSVCAVVLRKEKPFYHTVLQNHFITISINNNHLLIEEFYTVRTKQSISVKRWTKGLFIYWTGHWQRRGTGRSWWRLLAKLEDKQRSGKRQVSVTSQSTSGPLEN